MFCPNCGTRISENAKFCYNCGGKIEKQLSESGPGETAAAVSVMDQPIEIEETLIEAAAAQDIPEKIENEIQVEVQVQVEDEYPVMGEPEIAEDSFVTEAAEIIIPTVIAEEPTVSEMQAPQAPQSPEPLTYQSPLPYAQPVQNQDPPQPQSQQPQQRGQPYGKPDDQPYTYQPAPEQYYNAVKPPVVISVRITAAVALFFLLAGISLLCAPLVMYFDDILDCVKDYMIDDSVLSAAACILVPLSLAAGMFIDFVFALKSVFLRRKSGGLQILTFALSSFYFLVARECAVNDKILFEENEFTWGLTNGAWYFYENKLYKNWLLLAAICCFISLAFQITKMVLFRIKKHKSVPMPPYSF